ncbi:hypothetical protein D3C75_1056980 [compost metagenome]
MITLTCKRIQYEIGHIDLDSSYLFSLTYGRSKPIHLEPQLLQLFKSIFNIVVSRSIPALLYSNFNPLPNPRRMIQVVVFLHTCAMIEQQDSTIQYVPYDCIIPSMELDI